MHTFILNISLCPSFLVFTNWPLYLTVKLESTEYNVLLHSAWCTTWIHNKMKSVSVKSIRFCAYKVFTMWPMLTRKDLWIRKDSYTQLFDIHKPNLRSAFTMFHFWSLLSINTFCHPQKKRHFVFNKVHQCTKFDIFTSSLSWDIVLHAFSYFLTSVDSGCHVIPAKTVHYF